MSIFQTSKAHDLVMKLADQVAKDVLAPRAADTDLGKAYPAENLKVLFHTGLIGCHIPREFGGPQAESFTTVCALERLAAACASTAMSTAAYTAAADAILAAGSAEQKQKYLPSFLQGNGIAMAHEEGASGVSPISVTAEKTESGYILTGQKAYVGNFGNATAYIVTGLVDGKLSAFLVDADVSGLSFGAAASKIGLCAYPAGQLILDKCAVSDNALLGGEGKADKVLCAYDNALRLYTAAISVGLAQNAMDTAIEYVNQRIQFKQTIAKFQNTQYRAAEYYAQISAARAMVYMAAGKRDNGEDFAEDAAVAKLFASDTAAVTCKQCVQFMGGFGYTREYPAERMMRDGKALQLFGGRNEKQKAFIAKSIGVC